VKLTRVVAEYVALKQSLGVHFKTHVTFFKTFCRAMGDIDIREVDPDRVCAFLAGDGPITKFFFSKFYILRAFFRFAISRGYVASSPLPTMLPKQPELFQPHIYTQEELRRLIAATRILKTPRNPLRAETFRALLLMLYGAALRVSEALSLTLSDADLMESVLTIRNAKFYKTRLVPIGPKLRAEMRAYYEERRRRLPLPAAENSAFFVTRYGTAMSIHYVEKIFQELRSCADIRRRETSRYGPRLHDLRHSAAVHRLTAWYRDGADVQRLLPHLSVYLGHVCLSSTQRYLTMTPELFQEANLRFQRYARRWSDV